MDTPVANNGEQHRLVLNTSAVCTTEDGSTVFDVGDSLQIDWEAFQAALSRTYMVKPTDTIAVDLTGLSVQVMLISSDIPVQINYTQDAVARITKIKPLVFPVNYFNSTHSPSEKPEATQRGYLVLVGGDVTVLSLVGLASMPSANVRVSLAAYRT